MKTAAKIVAIAALLCAASFAAPEEYNQRQIHIGFSAVGNYIGIWNLDNDVYVKKEHATEETDGGETRSYYEQYLSGGHDLKGIGGSFGMSGLKKLGERLQLHLDLYLSLRYRFVEAEEHHSTQTEYIYESGTDTEKNSGSKGKYDISLTYWHIDIPVNLRYRFAQDFFVESGAFISYIVAANLKVKLISLDFQSYSAGMEFGIVAGFGKSFMLPHNRSLDVFSRFVFGLTPLLNDRVKKYLCEGIYPREWLIQAGVSYYLF